MKCGRGFVSKFGSWISIRLRCRPICKSLGCPWAEKHCFPRGYVCPQPRLPATFLPEGYKCIRGACRRIRCPQCKRGYALGICKPKSCALIRCSSGFVRKKGKCLRFAGLPLISVWYQGIIFLVRPQNLPFTESINDVFESLWSAIRTTRTKSFCGLMK